MKCFYIKTTSSQAQPHLRQLETVETVESCQHTDIHQLKALSAAALQNFTSTHSPRVTVPLNVLASPPPPAQTSTAEPSRAEDVPLRRTPGQEAEEERSSCPQRMNPSNFNDPAIFPQDKLYVFSSATVQTENLRYKA